MRLYDIGCRYFAGFNTKAYSDNGFRTCWIENTHVLFYLTHIACSVHGGEERLIQGFGWGTLRERDHFGDTVVHGRIILRWIFRKWDVGNGLDPAGSG
jgi:hypothetical protein